MQEENSTNSPSVPLHILAAIICIMFPVGLFIMLTPQYHKYLWTTSLFLLIQSILTYLILIRSSDVLKASITTIIVLLTAYVAEYVGVETGLPFGNYSYSDVLKPSVLGVPLAIPFAWLILVINSLVIFNTILSDNFFFTKILLSSMTVVSFDIMLEPFASFVNKFWIWNYNNIPLSNYIAWFAVAFLLCFTVSVICFRNKSFVDYKFSYLILIINMLNFTVINLVHGYYFNTFTGILFIAVILLSAYKIKHSHGI